MSATGLVLTLGLLLSGSAVEVVADGPLAPEPGLLELRSDAYQVRLGALLDVELRAGEGAATRIPRARLRADALVDTMVPVGMRLELELSPFADPADSLNGPGLLRDAYLRLGVGNRKVLDLGEIWIGQLRVPSSAASLRPPERWRFTRRPMIEERSLPGRDLGFVYHVDYGSHGWPLRLWLGSFGGGGANALNTALAPVVALRVEASPPLGPPPGLQLHTGLGLITGGQHEPVLLLIDARGRTRRFSFEALALLADGPGPQPLERAALRGELGVELLADFLELRLRHEATTLGDDRLRQRLTVGTAARYLDQAFEVLADYSVPLGPAPDGRGSELAVAFRLWW